VKSPRMIDIIIAVLICIYGAFISRLHGSELFPYKIVKSLLWALPFAAFTSWLYADYAWYVIAPVCLIVLTTCSLGKSTGQGEGIDLGTWTRGEPERLEFLIRWAEDKLSPYWYDALILLVTGLAAVLGASIAVGYINPMYGLILALGGALKPLAYMIGWKVYPKQATVIGEVLTGLFAYAPIAAVFLIEGI